jgi:hypothetical protein
MPKGPRAVVATVFGYCTQCDTVLVAHSPRPSLTGHRDWADIVRCGETKADRQIIERARTAIQRSRDLLALADYLRPEIKRKSSI